jgi:dTDP-4-dehydrorhamnose 3,5-epimerase
MNARKFPNGLIIMEPTVYPDVRGSFYELHKASSLQALGISLPLLQSNLSHSHQGVLRGLHYQQEPYAQAKLVSCLQGAIWDVVVDIRPTSPSYLRWYGFYLTEKSARQLWIPAGFLHGFYALAAKNIVLYHTTCEYRLDAEQSVHYASPVFSIPWPSNVIVSSKDALACHYDASKHIL